MARPSQVEALNGTEVEDMREYGLGKFYNASISLVLVGDDGGRMCEEADGEAQRFIDGRGRNKRGMSFNSPALISRSLGSVVLVLGNT